MKNVWYLVITILILITSVGCNNSTQKENEYNSKIINYIEPIKNSSILLTTWKNAEDIPVESMIALISSITSYDMYWDNKDNEYKVPFEIFYDNCSKYFDVPKKYLKTSTYYKQQTNCFESSFGYGGANDLKIDTVKETEQDILIYYTIYYLNNETNKNDIYCQGVLTIKKTQDGFKYKSCILTKEKAF